MNLKKLWKRNKKRGQTIVFIVLVFQILFIMVAMMINIGLVVHDKINLQNSVDLAAVYAVQRQAEVLNAMAHINYQIRQSYKLMAWRYFVLGNIGANMKDSSPTAIANYSILDGSSYPNKAQCPNLGKFGFSGPCDQSSTYDKKNAYAVCMKSPHWHRSTLDDDHFCQKGGFGSVRNLATAEVPPSFVTTWLPAIGPGGDINVIEDATVFLAKTCEGMSKNNWYTASYFLYAFRVDQWRRKNLIKNLFDQVLAQNKDIEGKSIRDGVEKTIQKNLTFSNSDISHTNHLRFDTFSTTGTTSFDDYFKWNQIHPALFYVFVSGTPTIAGQLNQCGYEIYPTFDGTIFNPSFNPEDNLRISSRDAYGHSSSDPYHPAHLSSGFYRINADSKKFYVKVHVTISNYKKQIFFPFNTDSIELKATAYAKPFGALFGPKPGQDPLLPTNSIPSTPNIPDLLANNLPNHSLFPTDPLGLIRQSVQRKWIEKIGPQLRSPENDGRTFVNYALLQPEVDPLVLNRHNNNHRIQPDNFKSSIRRLEELAIAPDIFDITYYTILPDYMTTLYPKMLNNSALDNFPGDLGFFTKDQMDAQELPNRPFTLQTWDQMRKGTDLPDCYNDHFRLNFIEQQILCAERLQDLYKVQNQDHVLTSWSSPDNGVSKIGKCDPKVSGSNRPQIKLRASRLFPDSNEEPYNTIPQGCLSGGRSGFSVNWFMKVWFINEIPLKGFF